MKRQVLTSALLIILVGALLSGCAGYPYAHDPYAQNRVAASSLGLGAFGAALGYAATGDPRMAAVGGLSGLVAGAAVGDAVERSRPPEAYEQPPAYYREDPGYYREDPGYTTYTRQRCRTVHTVVKRDGVIVDEYDREECHDY